MEHAPIDNCKVASQVLEDNRAEFTKRQVAAIEKSGVTFLDQYTGPLPKSFSNGKSYHGSNAMLLCEKAFSCRFKDSRWITAMQLKKNNLEVKPGEMPVLVEYWPSRLERESRSPKTFPVYNVEQVAGLIEIPDRDLEVLAQKIRLDEIDVMLKDCQVIYDRKDCDTFYDKDGDKLHLAAKDKYKYPEMFYSDALYGLVTRNIYKDPKVQSNLSRSGTSPLDAARNELRVSMAMMLLRNRYGLPLNPDRMLESIKNYRVLLTGLKNDPDELFRAANAADKVVSNMLAKNLEHFVVSEKQIHFLGIPGEKGRRSPVKRNLTIRLCKDEPEHGR